MIVIQISLFIITVTTWVVVLCSVALASVDSKAIRVPEELGTNCKPRKGPSVQLQLTLPL